MPLEFTDGNSVDSLGIKGDESFSLKGLNNIHPSCELTMELKQPDGNIKSFPVKVRIDTALELEYWKAGGILNYVLFSFMQ
ncbi:MAG: hypothetical protein KAH95_07415 [Spirochaetales bacterium]|nr:hypothetical protein [Spirochaetales bacterium]